MIVMASILEECSLDLKNDVWILGSLKRLTVVVILFLERSLVTIMSKNGIETSSG
ncbi:hypothetical protein Bpfe_018639, partial [Biomphalaria pfeifferi]